MPTLGDGVLTTSWIPGSSYGTYFCRCSKTLEFLPFLPKNAVPEKKNAVVRNCQSTWSGIFAVWSGTFAVWSGIFAAEKRVWHQYIRRNSGLPKKVVFMQNLFIEQKAEIKPLLKRQVCDI